MTHEEWMRTVNSEFQEEKLRKAALGELTPLSIDRENKTAEFSSRKGIYNTSLNRCTCGSFIHDKLPCKHMYRLAMELGEISKKFETAPEKIEKPSTQRTPSKSRFTKQEQHNAFVCAIELMEPNRACLKLAYDLIRSSDKTACCDDIAKVDVMFDNGMIEIVPGCSRTVLWHVFYKNVKEVLRKLGYTTKNNERLTNDYIERNAEEIHELLYPNIQLVRIPENSYLKIAPSKIKNYIAYRLGKRQPESVLIFSNGKTEWSTAYDADDDVAELLFSNISKYGAFEIEN